MKENTLPRKIFTVGHSNHQIDYFLELLQSQEIDCLIDVRSTPASSYNPQFNQLPLMNFLKRNGINYLHFKEEFGARQEDEDVLSEEGQVDFEQFQKTRPFQDGIERVDIGITKGFRIALMCSEGNPLECHRFSMISVYLEKEGIKVWHILKDKTLRSHQALEEEMMKKYEKKLPIPSLFEPDVDDAKRIKTAYQFHNKEIGWKVNRPDIENEIP